MATALVGTRKGLFVWEGEGTVWKIVRTAFLGDPVSMVCHDARDGMWYAALDLGHFGPKLWASADRGETWEERTMPSFPEDLVDENGPSVGPVWALTPGATAGEIWCGTLPGGLFRTHDGGQTWALVRSLWDQPERKNWFGGGFRYPRASLGDPRSAGPSMRAGGRVLRRCLANRRRR